MTVSKGEILYYLFLILTMGAKGIGWTGGQKPFTVCLAAAYLCFFIKLLMTDYSLKEWCLNAALLLMAAAIWKSSKETAALAAVCMVIGMKGVPIRRVMKVTLGIWGPTFLFSVLRGVLGLGDGVVVVHSRLGLGPIIRYSLGYTHPNVLHVTYFVVVMLLLYVFPMRGKRLWAACGLLFLGNLYIFLYSMSYTGVIIVTFHLCLNLYFDLRRAPSGPEKILLQCVAPFCIVFPIVGPLVIKGRLFDFFNKLLSTRFELVYFYFHEFRVSWFGTDTTIETEAHLTLDSSFAYLLMYYGIVAFVLFVTAYLLTIHAEVKNGKFDGTGILVSTALAGVTEQFLFNLSFKNISLFFVGDYIYNDLLERNREGVWNRRFCFLPGETIPIVKLNLSRGRKKFRMISGRICWGKCMFFAIFAAILSLLIFLYCWKMPERVYVNRRMAERYENAFTVEEGQEWNRQGSLFLGDMSPGEDVYELDGSILTMERARGGVSALVWGMAAGMAVTAGFQMAQVGRWHGGSV